MNPLFPDEPNQPQNAAAPSGNGYVLSHSPTSVNGSAVSGRPGRDASSPAVDLIRSKLVALYEDEPNATKELEEVRNAHHPLSRHQQFMNQLSASGKSLASIQTAWHAYYEGLGDDEKHEVWQEFYAANDQKSSYTKYVQKHTTAQPAPAPVTAATQPAPTQQQPAQPPTTATPAHHQHQPGIAVAPVQVIAPTTPQPPRPAVPHAAHHTRPVHHKPVVSEHLSPEPKLDKRSFAAIKQKVAKRAKAGYNAQIKARQHLQSLIFGIGLGTLVLVILLFGFFNEVIVAPFIHPNARAEATPIILSTDGVAPTTKNEVIIPKINVELPIIYGTSTGDDDIENSLEDGVVHYPTTSLPGQGGNAAFFGHSSNNIFNKGQYKFAFVLLHELEPGDIFYLTYNGKLYTYKVYQKKIVDPTEIGVLNPVADKPATATLITCDPPGTSLHRLVVWGEQITPDPSGNSTAPVQSTGSAPTQLPSNSPSMWSRVTSWFRR